MDLMDFVVLDDSGSGPDGQKNRKKDALLHIQLYSEFTDYLNCNHLNLEPNTSVLERCTHVCSRSCDIFSTRAIQDYFICVRTGQIHHCTPEKCNCYVTTKEANVCPVSKYTWPLEELQADFKYLTESHNTDRDIEKKCTLQSISYDDDDEDNKQGKKEKNRVKRQKTIEDTELEGKALGILNRLCASQLRKKLDNGTHRTAERRIQSRFHHYINSQIINNESINITILVCIYVALSQRRSRKNNYLVQRPKSPPLEYKNDLLRKYAQTCVYWWHQLVDLRPPNLRNTRYRFVYHCIALLFNLQRGFQHCSKTYIQPDITLTAILPQANQLAQLGYHMKVYTQHSESLRNRLYLFFKNKEAQELK